QAVVDAAGVVVAGIARLQDLGGETLEARNLNSCHAYSPLVDDGLDYTNGRAILSSGMRKRRADGERSRRTILDAAAKLATVDGLEGLSIGRLAEHIGMSKSGLYAHFGSKQELQLATIETAGDVFTTEVLAPAEAAATPVAKLETLCDLFLTHVERRTFPGGCFFASAAAEFDTHPGAVRERIAEFERGWLETFARL